MNHDASQAFDLAAVYKEQLVFAYRGNRFIEALPDITDPEVEIQTMQRLVTVTEKERAAPAFLRMHMIGTFTASFLQPLEQHIELAARFSVMLRVGYLTRNPNNPAFLRKLGIALAKLNNLPNDGNFPKYSKASGGGMALIGMSGVGKSRAIEAVLDAYPQVIHHTELTGPIRTTYQLVWIKVSCPTDGSIKAVCRAFFAAVDTLLGTNYHHINGRNNTLEQMRDAMCSIAFMHGLGTLVIDEIQNLRRATGYNADALLRFFLVLRDDLNVPVIVIGTETAEEILGGSMQVARRHTGVPLFERMKFDATFMLFCESMFHAQYLRDPIEPTAEILKVLYELSQGVTDFILKIFVLAQWRTIALGLERLSAEILREVYNDCLTLIHPYIDQLRQGVAYDEAGLDDTMHATTLGNLQQLASSPVRVPNISTPRELSSLTATRPRRASTSTSVGPKVVKRKQGAISKCEMVRLVQASKVGEGAYDILKSAGFIRDLGMEVINEKS